VYTSSDWTYKGLVVLAKKDNRLLVSDAAFLNYADFRGAGVGTGRGPFNQTVPGRIGDPHAGYDPVFQGAGWRYIGDPEYIVFSSLDYDSTGVDISGNNYNDWPIRYVSGVAQYVVDPKMRASYKPAYKSDEDMFCVYKDTDTRADQMFAGPNGPSIPIGVEVQNTVYTWGSGPGKDIVIFVYDIINKSTVQLDSCYVLWSSALHVGWSSTANPTLYRKVSLLPQEPWRNLLYTWPTVPSQWPAIWPPSPVPPTLGYGFFDTPRGYDGSTLGLTVGASSDEFIREANGTNLGNDTTETDDFDYRRLTYPHIVDSSLHTTINDGGGTAMLLSGPFRMTANASARVVIKMMFADSLPHLLLLDDFITRVYNSGFKRPVPPPAPHLTAQGLNRAVKLSWDNVAESATDEMIPDSLGRPFVGYKLLRAPSQEGPYVQLGQWHTDTLLVHEFLDRGEDLASGLKNNVRYYYQLLSFDEGAKKLKLDPMDSPPVDGVNSVSIVPTTEPSNATSAPGSGEFVSGTLGDVSGVQLIPTNVTNFNNLMSGRTLQVSIDAATDGVRYMLPVTIRDTVAGRTQNAIVDPGLLVHGSAQTAGVKQGAGLIKNIFGIGAADVSVAYRFEQLADSFRIVPQIESTQGADVPIVLNDSLRYTGIQLITPYTTSPKEILVEFSTGGIDTINTLFRRYVPYLNVRVVDVPTGAVLRPDSDYAFRVLGVKRTGGSSFNRSNRYYLSGLISNGEVWDWGHTFSMYQSRIGFDFTDHGVGSGKPTPTFNWGSTHRQGTTDFQAGDRARIRWQGGVRATFPKSALLNVTGPAPGRTDVTQAMMDGIRIVPNPYLVHHEAQRGDPRIYFNYLPEECEIRIYTVALDLVKTMRHSGGSREEWNLQTEGGQLVASQLLIAYIEAPNGVKTTKKFAVVVGR
jgi:hypothetical protein